MRIFSIDPGSVSGAWAFHEIAGGPPGAPAVRCATCGDIPLLGSALDVLEIERLLDAMRPDYAVIEQAMSFKQGATGAFNYGAA